MRNRHIEKDSTVENTNKSLVVVTYFCCGKTTLAKKEIEGGQSIIDFDSFLIESIRDTGNIDPEARKRIERFGSLPINNFYLSSLKDTIGKYDIILLSSKVQILEFLRKRKIPYVLVYPENTKECMEEWGRRNKERGTEWLWRDNKDGWNSLLKLLASDKSAIKHITLKQDEFLSDKLSELLSCLSSLKQETNN